MLIYLQAVDDPSDQSKFQRVFQRYHRLMFTVANGILRNQQDAEDAVQEAFWAIAKNISKISDPDCNKTQSYVVTIVERKAIDLYRAKKRRPAAELTEDVAAPPADVPGGGLAAAISRLSPRDQAFILLKYDNGCTNRELMEILDLSYEGVHSLDARVKERLRALLKEEGIDV